MGTAPLVLTTILSFLPTEAWWAVGWRYGRLQLAGIGLLLGVVAIATRAEWIAVTALACTLCHLLVIGVYALPPWGASWVRDTDDAPSLRVLTLNVQRDNPDRERIRAFLEGTDADAVLLIEVTQTWLDLLRPALEPNGADTGSLHAVEAPREDDHYGMALYSRLPIRTSDVDTFGCRGRPGIRAIIETPDGPVEIWGLHPEPPHPGQSSHPKDVYLLDAAERLAQTRNDAAPRIALGDLNDVAWSATTQTFLEKARLVDPRPGRGMFCTFHAESRLARWPIDHVFHDARLRCDHLEVLDPVGSDHHPVFATFRVAPADREPGPVHGVPTPGPSRAAHSKASDAAREHLAGSTASA